MKIGILHTCIGFIIYLRLFGDLISMFIRTFAITVIVSDGLTGNKIFCNFICTVALGSTQPLTGMSTRNLPGGKGQPVCKADNLTVLCGPIV
jgi:hypothetical protein